MKKTLINLAAPQVAAALAQSALNTSAGITKLSGNDERYKRQSDEICGGTDMSFKIRDAKRPIHIEQTNEISGGCSDLNLSALTQPMLGDRKSRSDEYCIGDEEERVTATPTLWQSAAARAKQPGSGFYSAHA